MDHGNRNMKTTHFLFTTGLSSTDRKPAGREDFLQTEGKYYVLSGKRIPYQRDKTQDERFSILTRFAIAKELERTGQVAEEDVVQVSLQSVCRLSITQSWQTGIGNISWATGRCRNWYTTAGPITLVSGMLRYIPRRMLP